MIFITINTQNDNITICLATSSHPDYTKNILDKIFEQDFNKCQIICLMDETCPDNQDLINNYQSHENIQTITPTQKDLLKDIESEYLLYLDANNYYQNMDLNNIHNYLKKHDLDVLSFNPKFIYENQNISYENNSSLKKDFVNKVFSMPKFINAIYKVDYLKSIKVEIPWINDYSEKLFFYFKTMFSTSKIHITEKTLFNKRILNNDIQELILTDFRFENEKIDDVRIDTEKFFKTMYDLTDIFEENSYMHKYNYQIVNYIFSLLRNIYQLQPINEEEYFKRLKEFVDTLSQKYSDNLTLQLKYDNMQFWKNVSESHSLSELKLRYDYEKLLIEKEKAEYQQKSQTSLIKKFLTGRFDVKNKGGPGNGVEVVDAIEGNVNMRFPSWFKDASGSGLIVESSEGVIDFSVRCVGDGVFTLWLKGVDFRDSVGKRVPVFVDFTRLLVDGVVVFDENRLVSHDSSFIFEKKVLDGDEVKIHAEWIPLNKNSKYTVKKR